MTGVQTCALPTAIYCVQKLNQTVAMTADTRQDVQDVDAGALSGDEQPAPHLHRPRPRRAGDRW